MGRAAQEETGVPEAAEMAVLVAVVASTVVAATATAHPARVMVVDWAAGSRAVAVLEVAVRARGVSEAEAVVDQVSAAAAATDLASVAEVAKVAAMAAAAMAEAEAVAQAVGSEAVARARRRQWC